MASSKAASGKRKAAGSKRARSRQPARKKSASSPRSSAGSQRKSSSSQEKAPARRGPQARSPEGADELKVRLGRLATTRGRIRTLKRSLNRNFHQIGTLLAEIEEDGLHEVKGYGSFEAFLEREVDLSVQLGLRLLRIARTFRQDAAEAAGLERTAAALEVLEGAVAAAGNGAGAPLVPPHKR